MYITYEKNNYDPSIVEELLYFTYEESTQELLEDVFSEGLDLNDSDQHAIAMERERVSYFNFLEEFVNCKEREQFIAVHKSNNRIVTALRMLELCDGEWFLEALETAPSERGKGYGKALVKEVIRDIKTRKGTTIKAHISKKNINSINLHKACGFVQTDRPAIDEEGYHYKNSYEFEYLL